MSLTLACGPYFDEAGFLVSLVLFVAIKPLAYFAFIQAFRYRVSRPAPMRIGQAVKLAALRAGLGIAFTGAGAAALYAAQSPELLALSWVYLYAERLFSWWLVGQLAAGLRGRRLVGWIISGTLINAAFDVAMVWGLIDGVLPQVAIVAGIAVFIGLLHTAGRRASLRLRYRGMCGTCGYDLTGNRSGACPECGKSVMA